mgnify:CR=1 FL=1
MKKVNVIFMGTTQFSVAILETLKKISSVNLLGVVCQPDKAMDRNKNYIYSPVKQYCLNNNVTLYQPKSIIELKEVMINSQIDLIITCAYGQFVPDTILNIPTLGSYNIHASLLPKYRGGAPIHYAIINGDLSTGITLMKMSKKMDAGDIIFQKSCSISPTETYLSLSSKLAIVASELLEENWNLLVTQNFNSIQQDESQVTFALNIKKEETIIDFDNNCQNIEQKIRGLYNKPIALWKYNDLFIKIHSAVVTKRPSNLSPGKITTIDKTGIFVATKDYDLQIVSLQLPNKTVQFVGDIINGKHIFKVG